VSIVKVERLAAPLLALGLVVAASSCTHQKAVLAPTPAQAAPAPAPARGPAGAQPEPTVPPAATMPQSGVVSSDLPTSVEAINKAGYLKDVFFDTDKAELRADSRDTLAADAEWLKRYPTVKVQIEGHCDERNTEAYNLALGWRRCNATKDYLVSVGVAADRLATISYGEERPFATCHNESCWWQNRRSHFVVTAR
jgi:peptidoglycan-associated lipoprotein